MTRNQLEALRAVQLRHKAQKRAKEESAHRFRGSLIGKYGAQVQNPVMARYDMLNFDSGATIRGSGHFKPGRPGEAGRFVPDPMAKSVVMDEPKRRVSTLGPRYTEPPRFAFPERSKSVYERATGPNVRGKVPLRVDSNPVFRSSALRYVLEPEDKGPFIPGDKYVLYGRGAPPGTDYPTIWASPIVEYDEYGEEHRRDTPERKEQKEHVRVFYEIHRSGIGPDAELWPRTSRQRHDGRDYGNATTHLSTAAGDLRRE